MHKKTRYGDFTFGWDQTLGNMETNAGELSHLEHARLALQGIRERVRRLQYEQAYHEAERQRATREMQEALAEGEKTATFLRMGIKLVYGNDNDKLLEFGIQPLRRRSGGKRKKAAAREVILQEVAPEPEAPGEKEVQEVSTPAPASEEDVLLARHPADPGGSQPLAGDGTAGPAPDPGEGDGTGAMAVVPLAEEESGPPVDVGDGRPDAGEPGRNDRRRDEAVGQLLISSPTGGSSG